MKTVQDVLSVKGHDVWTIGAEASVYEAIKLMTKKKIGALMVVDNDIVVGVISETDYTRKIILEGRLSRQTRVKDIMTTNVYSIRPDQDIEKCMIIMTDKCSRHLPVIDNNKLIGVISTGDVVKSVIDEQRFTIEQLESYIAG